MQTPLYYRERYHSQFVTILPDEQSIPWNPLSLDEYTYYNDMVNNGLYPIAYVENEIFKHCVQNKVLVDSIDTLKAGVISTVVSDILNNSLPKTPFELENLLNYSRAYVDDVFHDLIGYICQAFPSYTPDQLLKMDVITFMKRAACAERKLLRTGIITEPFKIATSDQDIKPIKQTRAAVPPTTNLAKEFKAQTAVPRTVISTKDIAEHQVAYTGHEKTDKLILESNMLKETAGIYDDYINQIKNKQTVTIKTPEERKAAALARAEQNKKKYQEASAKKKVSDQAELERLAKARKTKRTAKK